MAEWFYQPVRTESKGESFEMMLLRETAWDPLWLPDELRRIVLTNSKLV
jgi:hypothetical protein